MPIINGAICTFNNDGAMAESDTVKTHMRKFKPDIKILRKA
jgi:hypothetical protein